MHSLKGPEVAVAHRGHRLKEVFCSSVYLKAPTLQKMKYSILLFLYYLMPIWPPEICISFAKLTLERPITNVFTQLHTGKIRGMLHILFKSSTGATGKKSRQHANGCYYPAAFLYLTVKFAALPDTRSAQQALLV